MNRTLPWGQLFGLFFMTMGPLRALAIIAAVDGADTDPAKRRLATRACVLTGIALLIAVLLGDGVLAAWKVSRPSMIAAAGAILFILSIQALLGSPAPSSGPRPAAAMSATGLAFPGLMPPVAVGIAVIFAAYFPGLPNKAAIAGLGILMVLLNWIVMRYANRLMGLIGGASTLSLLGAVFGVLQVALAIEFMVSALQAPIVD